CLQLLLGARQPTDRRRGWGPCQVARSHPRDGGWPDRPSLDDARPVGRPDPLAAPGCPQAPGPPAEAESGLRGGSNMITVPWGPTGRQAHSAYSANSAKALEGSPPALLSSLPRGNPPGSRAG